MASAGQIDRLGKRFRDGAYGDEEVRALEEYRASFDEILLANTKWVGETLAKAELPAVFAGRAKRTKSTIRKLARPQNANMDLSRMVDMVGVRVVVRDMAAHKAAVEKLESRFLPEETKNYLDDGKPYRAVHLHLKQDRDFRRLEIQVRTIPQQLWANESESFGEQVKEGAGPPEIREYLEELSAVARDLDNGKQVKEESLKSPLFVGRATLGFRLPLLQRSFDEAVKAQTSGSPSRTYIVVFDNEVNARTQMFAFEDAERATAVQEYQRVTRSVDDSRYETLILNSPSDAVLRVTHPRFFPETA